MSAPRVAPQSSALPHMAQAESWSDLISSSSNSSSDASSLRAPPAASVPRTQRHPREALPGKGMGRRGGGRATQRSTR
eukprot:877697-Rhodomonas_salina.1